MFCKAWRYFFKDIKLYCCYSGTNLEVLNFLKCEFDEVSNIPFSDFNHSIYAAQSGRVYCAGLVKNEGFCITTDIDLIPLNSNYFVRACFEKGQGDFIIFRDVLLSEKQIAISYCGAYPSVWTNLTGVADITDAIKKISEDINIIQPDGIKGGPSWFYDQIKLYELILGETTANFNIKPNINILQDEKLNFSRLDRAYINCREIFLKNTLINLSKTFSDFHLPDIEVSELDIWVSKFQK